MKRKRSPRERSSQQEPVAAPVGDGLRSWQLGLFAALVVATPLLPSETVELGGSAMALILLWLLLFFGWAAAGAARGRLTFRGGASWWILLLFLAWHTISALVMAPHGHPRAALNMAWQWLALGLCFLLARQLVRTAAERRALIALMMSLAVALSALGYYQYFREHPLTRQHYLDNPDKVLRDAGIFAPAGTPQRDAFENRLFSTEPFATFALTNSLAGFLSPWLIVVLGIGITNFSGPTGSRNTKLAALLSALLIAGCWLLTKSRTAWLATIFGVVLLAIYGRRTGWRPDARIVGGVAAAAVLLPFVAFVVGGLDAFVLLEASKAMLYRVQYWRATAQLIADYPWLGCGPGNFQQYYTAYKLPEASETIAEPHNFILEIWATAGTPAIILFVAFWVALAWQVWRSQRVSAAASEPTFADPGSVRAVYWGGLAGALFAYVVCPSLEGYSLSAGLLVIGFPLAAGAIGLWHDWVMRGHWPVAVPAIAIAVVLINLLAAGGIGFANVAGTLWLLAALTVQQAEERTTAATERVVAGRMAAAIALLGLLAVGLFTQTGYLPQLNRETWLSDGDARRLEGQSAAAMAAYRKATEVDPYSPDGWERLADYAHQLWLSTGNGESYQAFVEASERMLALNVRASTAHSQVGRWWLAAYRRLGRAEYLDKSILYYRIATKLYPNYNFGHAELAWVLALAGKEREAAESAREALRLDQLTPHTEQKLAEQRVYDSPAPLPNQPPLPGDRTAEQLMQELRTK